MRKLQARARKLNSDLSKKVYSSAVRRAGRSTAFRAIQGRTPSRTGTLRKALSIRANNKPAQHLYGVKIAPRGLYASQRTARRRGAGAVYKPDWVARYYRFVVTGTKYHPANTFLTAGLEGSSGAFLATLRREILTGIETYSA
jgi:hypothetical protein